jgi:hypothetical protein
MASTGRTKTIFAEEYKRIIAELRRLRLTARLSQRTLGARLRRAQSWVCKIEKLQQRLDLHEFVEWLWACRVYQADPVLDAAFGGPWGLALERSKGGDDGGGGAPRPDEQRPNYPSPGPEGAANDERDESGSDEGEPG